ncbi:MAG: hypothetical protein LBI48_09665 [Burkholderiaceae bacterium]|nr:hypothetical protein [Burkholderiaceae bacterium]
MTQLTRADLNALAARMKKIASSQLNHPIGSLCPTQAKNQPSRPSSKEIAHESRK